MFSSLFGRLFDYFDTGTFACIKGSLSDFETASTSTANYLQMTYY